MASPLSKLPPDIAYAHAKHWLNALQQATPDVPVFSPVLAGRDLDVIWDHRQWMLHSIRLLRRFDMLVVPPISGWQESAGVAEEIAWCRAHNRRVVIL